MPAFEPPRITEAKNTIWKKVAKPDFRSPDVLWTDCWHRFNTITIPIQDEDAFFADATAAAKTAQNREDLEELMRQKSADRRADLEKTLRDLATAAVYDRSPFSSPAARDATLKAGQTGSLDSFLQIACGVAFGWRDACDEVVASRLPTDEAPGLTSDGVFVGAYEDTVDAWEYKDTTRFSGELEEDEHPHRARQEPVFLDGAEQAEGPAGPPCRETEACPADKSKGEMEACQRDDSQKLEYSTAYADPTLRSCPSQPQSVDEDSDRTPSSLSSNDHSLATISTSVSQLSSPVTPETFRGAALLESGKRLDFQETVPLDTSRSATKVDPVNPSPFVHTQNTEYPQLAKKRLRDAGSDDDFDYRDGHKTRSLRVKYK